PGELLLFGKSVVGVFPVTVVGNITHAFQFRDTFHQGLFDAILEGGIDHAAALAAAAKLQDGDTFIDDIHQADLAAVASQPRIDLGLQVVVDALGHWAVFADHRYL